MTLSTTHLRTLDVAALALIVADKSIKRGIRKQALIMQWGLEDGVDYWANR